MCVSRTPRPPKKIPNLLHHITPARKAGDSGGILRQCRDHTIILNAAAKTSGPSGHYRCDVHEAVRERKRAPETHTLQLGERVEMA